MEALVGYLSFNYFVSAILGAWGPELGVDFAAEPGGASGLALVAGIKTLDMGMVGALVVSGIVIALHDRFFDTRLPEWLGVFSGSTFVYMLSFCAMLPLAGVAVLVWPRIQAGMCLLQAAIVGAGTLGVGAFVFLERVLIPFGLHHLLYAPAYYDNVVVGGGIYAAWANALPQLAASTAPLKELTPWAAITATGWSKLFGTPGIAAAMYVTARPQNRRRLLALLVPATLTAVLCGVTEPLEFTFLFVAPPLFVMHAALAALLSMAINLLGVVGVFSGGLIEMSSFNFVPLAATHGGSYLAALGVGVCFALLYFVTFRALILHFDFLTPGRGVGPEFELGSKGAFRSLHGMEQPAVPSDDRDELAARLLELLGGPQNVEDVSCCATRLRVSVADPALVAADDEFVCAGAVGVMRRGQALQVVVGLSVATVLERLCDLIEG